MANPDICSMYQCYLLLGSNQGDRTGFLEQARNAITGLGKVVSVSSLYETAAWGLTDQPSFLNQALGVSTDLPAETLMEEILNIELKLGRTRAEKYGPRTIDIDILLYEDLVHRSESLTLPHPELPNRRFALTALAEIAGTQQHPVENCSIQALLERCQDPLPLNRYNP